MWAKARKLAGKGSGNGRWPIGEETERRVKIRMCRTDPCWSVHFGWRPRIARMESTVGLSVQGSERFWFRCYLPGHKEKHWWVLGSVAWPSQQVWSGFQNGCLGRVRCTSVEHGSAWLEGQWWSEISGMMNAYGKWKIPLGLTDTQLCGSIWVDKSAGRQPDHITTSRGVCSPCEAQFLPQMKGVGIHEHLGSFQHWNSKTLFRNVLSLFSNFTLE